jgi:radical SAM superfamily enzyme YgiQ (UPF0313 family)
MRIALVFPPYGHKKFAENIEVVSNRFGVFPPLGLLYVAAILEKHGHKVMVIDAFAQRLSMKDVLKKLRAFNPDMLGFMLTIWMFRQTYEWIRFLRDALGIPVVVGNYCMEIYPEAVMGNEAIDFGIIGSALKPLPALVEALEKNKPLDSIRGLAFKKNGGPRINFPKALHDDLDELPFPARHLIDNSVYAGFLSQLKNFTIMVTAKGCPSACTFCDMSKTRYVERSVNNVVDEMEECYQRFGIREIDIFDRSFTINRRRVREICREIRRRRLLVTWSCRTRVDQVDEGLLREMAKAGCRTILYGIESGDQDILDNEQKGLTKPQIRDALEKTKRNGIRTHGFFMIGQPGDTKETVIKTIRFAKELDLDYAQFLRTVPKPGALLYDSVKKEMGYDYFDRYIRGEVGEMRLPRPWTELTEAETLNLVKMAYRQFYFRPSFMFKRLLGAKSFGEITRYAKVGLEMLLKKQKADLEEDHNER